MPAQLLLHRPNQGVGRKRLLKEGGRRRGLLATPTTFIQKPFTPEALVRTVQQELDAGPAPATEVS